MPGIEHEFFGCRFTEVSSPTFHDVPDTYFGCKLCGVRIEFSAIVDHAKFHRWVEYQKQELEERVALLERTLAELTGEVVPIGNREKPEPNDSGGPK